MLGLVNKEQIASSVKEEVFLVRVSFLIYLLLTPILIYTEHQITGQWYPTLVFRGAMGIYALTVLAGSFRYSAIRDRLYYHMLALTALLLLHTNVMNYLTACNLHYSMLNIVGMLVLFYYVKEAKVALGFFVGGLAAVWLTEAFLPQFTPEATSYFFVASGVIALGYCLAIFRIDRKDRSNLSWELYNLLAENTTDIISVHDTVNDKVMYVSPSVKEVLGFTPEEIIGKPNLSWYIPEDVEAAKKALHPKMYLKNNHILVRFRIAKKDGTHMWIEANNKGVIKNGRLVQTICITRNIEDRKKAEMANEQYMLDIERMNKRLSASNQELERFAYIASHDLKEPLRTVGSYVQLLERRYGHLLDAEGQEFINYAVSGSQRMGQLITDLFSYSKVGALRVVITEVNLDDVLFGVLNSLRSKIVQSQAEIEHDSMPVLRGDRFQLGQLFQNLIDNAIKYRSERTPKVQISVEEFPHYWQFAFRDNGIGINAEYREKVFEIFTRLHGMERFEGTGVGLAICKRVVINHNGAIWIEAAPGGGSIVNFTIAKEIVTSEL